MMPERICATCGRVMASWELGGQYNRKAYCGAHWREAYEASKQPAPESVSKESDQ
jgi:hypothetical protein